MVAKQRVVDNFSGDALNERWTQTNIQGSAATYAMVDTIDEGFSISNPSSSPSSRNEIDFNSIAHYSNTASRFIAVIKHVNNGNGTVGAGFTSTTLTGANRAYVSVVDNGSSDNFGISTNDGSTTSRTAGTTAVDANWHTVNLALFSTHASLLVDGSYEVVDTANLPTTNMEPVFGVIANTSTALEGRIRYLEAYNT